MKHFFLFLLIGLTFAACTQKSNREHPRELTEEEKKIDSVLTEAVFYDLEGKEVHISDFKGKVILVDFWETWCGPCLQVFPAMDSLQNEYPEDFVVLAVNLNSSDTEEDVKQFQSENSYTFRYLIDKNNVGEEVITLGIPFKIYIDPNGYLIKSELGSAGTQGDYEKAKAIIEEFKISNTTT